MFQIESKFIFSSMYTEMFLKVPKEAEIFHFSFPKMMFFLNCHIGTSIASIYLEYI